jgi:hypothetical protein
MEVQKTQNVDVKSIHENSKEIEVHNAKKNNRFKTFRSKSVNGQMKKNDKLSALDRCVKSWILIEDDQLCKYPKEGKYVSKLNWEEFRKEAGKRCVLPGENWEISGYI